MTIGAARTGLADPPKTAGPAIRLIGVHKRFGSRLALSDVDLDIGPTAVHGLLGPNGAGKTTLLRLLFGLVAPDAGRVEVLGRDPYGNPGEALAGVAGFVEAPAFYPYLTAAKNLDFLAGLDGHPDGPGVDEVLDQVGLLDRRSDKVGGFSTGMKQRLGIASALLRDPRLLILDEPTSGLDLDGTRELHDLIASIAARGRTVLISSHDLAEVERACSEVTVLARGTVRYSGTLQRLRDLAPDPSHELVTADDVVAAELAVSLGLTVTTGSAIEAGQQLIVRAGQLELDELVLALGRRGIPIRRLARHDTALQTLVLRLTGDPAG